MKWSYYRPFVYKKKKSKKELRIESTDFIYLLRGVRLCTMWGDRHSSVRFFVNSEFNVVTDNKDPREELVLKGWVFYPDGNTKTSGSFMSRLTLVVTVDRETGVRRFVDAPSLIPIPCHRKLPCLSWESTHQKINTLDLVY